EINNPTIQKQSITRQKKINSRTQSPAKEFVFTASDKSSPESNALTYKVKSGDTLDKIAQRYHLNLQDLLAANQITNPNLIRVDSLLNIPLQTKEKTQEKSNTALDIKSQSLKNNHIQQLKQDIAKLKQEYSDSSQITQSLTDKTSNSSASNLTDNLNNSQETIVGTVPNALSNYNSVLSNSIGDKVGPDLPALLSPEQYLPNAPKKFNGYIWPAKGVLTSGYGMRWGRMHKGIDIAGPVGTPIVAAAPGEVVYASWNSGGYGNLVKLKHPNGSITLYAHNSKIFVRKGQFVGQGQQIAAMGSTGFSTGPHLHFEIHPLGSTAVNPMRFLAKKSN
ncbi:MAG: M23 family metallopeptidase, partial [Cyanobacteria bacterium J083]